MEFVRGLGPSRNLILALSRPRSTRSPTPALLNAFAHRQLSTSSSQHATADPTKPIVLEKPDKFRPPSHPQRLNRRAPRNYPGPALSEPEREAQKTRRYPHTFPNPGTKLHWFLTTWWIHLCITMGTLSLLALISLTQTFLHTSPFGHLVPPIRSLLFHPFSYVSEWISVIKLHTAYRSELVQQKRNQDMLDTQKRRIYRRAHGMEDLNRAEDQGIDVRGVVPWDDGLTNVERANGGRREPWKLVPGGEVKCMIPCIKRLRRVLGRSWKGTPRQGMWLRECSSDRLRRRRKDRREERLKGGLGFGNKICI